MRVPGHYISLQRNATQADFVRPLSMPGVVGVQRRYVWRDLQTPLSVNTDAIRPDVNLAGHLGGRLVVFIEDKTFTPENPAPDYLSDYTHMNKQGGYTAARWNPIVASELRYLCDTIYHEFTDHPGFGGIALQESAPGLSDEALDAGGYDPDVYIRTLIEANCDYLYLNYIPRAQDRLGEVIAGTKAMVGGPDVLPDSVPLRTHVYPHFVKAPNRVRQFGSVQFDSYAHEIRGSDGFWTLDSLIEWAVTLRVETLFWNAKTWDTPKGSYTVEDAYAAIARRPVL